MLDIFKRDLLMYKSKIAIFVPIFSTSLIILFPKADEGFFVMGLPLVFLISIMVFVLDDMGKGVQMLISQPITRQGIARGRFVSAWIFMGLGGAFIILLGLVLSIIVPEARGGFLKNLNLNTLMIYLWFLTALCLPVFPILYALMGRGIQGVVFLGLGLNALLGVFFFFRFEQRGPDLFAGISSLVHGMIDFHQSYGNILLSLVLILVLNLINMRICEWILVRKEF